MFSSVILVTLWKLRRINIMEKDIIYLKSSENMDNIPDESVDLIVTSPPYNIDIKYGNKTSHGKTVSSKGEKYSDNLPEDEYRRLLKNVFTECKRVLKPNGSIWINIKNRYDGKSIITPFWIEEFFKDMFLKNLIVWNFDWGGSTNKRFAPRYEFIFWYTKDSKNYHFDLDAVKIPAVNYRPDRYKSQMKNPSDVWKIPMISGNFLERTGHPAQYPEKLIERVIRAGTSKGDVVLDPFMGSGTTAVVAKKLNRHFIGFEIVPEYIEMANKRLENREVNADDKE